jgi:cytochrome c biogenesis protein CcmG, thiol:disulfide interchange protein DsbE
LRETSDRVVWGAVALAGAAVIVLAIAHHRNQVEEEPPQSVGVTPSLSLPLLDGSGKASIVRGRVTVVDFWATWCAPCRASMPRVQSVWKEYRPRGVDLYSVDTDDPGASREAEVREFLVQNKLEFPVVLDDGSATSAFSVAGLPTMVVVGRDGSVLWNHVGTLTPGGERQLRDVLDRALARTASN